MDPFRHHPELRNRINSPEQSYFRDLDIEELDARVVAAGHPPDWRTPCKERDAARQAFLKDRMGRDLWVFGYGSLMWDPAMDFAEVRLARTDAHSRAFNLWDDGGRGSQGQPGLMLTLDSGTGCTGLAFRIEADAVEHETFVLWRREMITHAYRPAFFRIETDQGPVEALSFLADHSSSRIHPGIPIDQQARMIAHAEGVLGTSFDYLEGVLAHLEIIGIEDSYVSDLHARASALRAA